MKVVIKENTSAQEYLDVVNKRLKKLSLVGAILFLILMGITILSIIFDGVRYSVLCIGFVFLAGFIFLLTWTYRISKLHTKTSQCFVGTSIFTFSEDNLMVTSESKLSQSVCEMKYARFTYVNETRDCFYLYLNSARYYYIKKSGLIEGELSELTTFLVRTFGNKYVYSHDVKIFNNA